MSPFKENWDHFKHLGLPISKDNLKSEIWTSSINKMKKKTQNWGMKWLNLAKRVIFIKKKKYRLSHYTNYQSSKLQKE